MASRSVIRRTKVPVCRTGRRGRGRRPGTRAGPSAPTAPPAGRPPASNEACSGRGAALSTTRTREVSPRAPSKPSRSAKLPVPLPRGTHHDADVVSAVGYGAGGRSGARPPTRGSRPAPRRRTTRRAVTARPSPSGIAGRKATSPHATTLSGADSRSTRTGATAGSTSTTFSPVGSWLRASQPTRRRAKRAERLRRKTTCDDWGGAQVTHRADSAGRTEPEGAPGLGHTAAGRLQAALPLRPTVRTPLARNAGPAAAGLDKQRTVLAPSRTSGRKRPSHAPRASALTALRVVRAACCPPSAGLASARPSLLPMPSCSRPSSLARASGRPAGPQHVGASCHLLGPGRLPRQAVGFSWCSAGCLVCGGLCSSCSPPSARRSAGASPGSAAAGASNGAGSRWRTGPGPADAEPGPEASGSEASG